MKKQKLYDNGYSYILLSNDIIQILRVEDDMFSPRSIKVWSTLQVELGRPLDEIRQCLAKSRVPIFARKVEVPVNNISAYQLIKMHTGNIPDKILVNIIEKDNKIVKIAFNKDLVNDKELRSKYQLPTVYQLRLAALNINDNKELETYFTKQINMILNTLFRGTAVFLKADYKPEKVEVYIDAGGQELKLTFLRSNDEKSYELVSISV